MRPRPLLSYTDIDNMDASVPNKNTINLFLLLAGLMACIYLVVVISYAFQNVTATYDESLFQQRGTQRTIVSFRNDDLTLGSNLEHEQAIISIFDKYSVKQTFSFIPKTGSNNEYPEAQGNGSPEIIDALQKWEQEGKIELALHGYAHKKNPRTGGEFGGSPLEEQRQKIQDGREIIKQILNSDVTIFAPPWNHADPNTLRACLDSGIKIFSGFWGEPPIDGLAQVNVNALLFRSNSEEDPRRLVHRILSAEEMLQLVAQAPGTKFCNIFYHSNTDFDTPDKLNYLDNFLKAITSDPTIQISTIGEIPTKYSAALAAHNQANLCVGNILRIGHYAKPYSFIEHAIRNVLAQKSEYDDLYHRAFEAYWEGEYQEACILSSRIINRTNSLLGFCRLGLYILIVSTFLLLSRIASIKMARITDKHLLKYKIVGFTFPFVLGLSLNLFHWVSDARVSEFNRLLLVYVLAMTTSKILHHMSRSARNSHYRSKMIPIPHI